MDISAVSRTAILTLICRAAVSEKENTLFNDPMAVQCLEQLISIASVEEKRWIIDRRKFYSSISYHDAKAGARRARTFDDIANQYIAVCPHCTVINLACGFDTRFWRIANENCRYIEIDLPEVIAVKKEILKDQLAYDLIGLSALDPTWMEQVTAHGNSHILVLAEGLLMFLSQPEVTWLFQQFAQRFTESMFSFDMVREKYLRGIWKWLLRLETRINWQLDARWISGMNDPAEIESYATGLHVLGNVKGSAGPVITVSINPA